MSESELQHYLTEAFKAGEASREVEIEALKNKIYQLEQKIKQWELSLEKK